MHFSTELKSQEDNTGEKKMESYRYEIKAKKTECFKEAYVKSSVDAYNYAMEFYHEDINIYESCFMMMINNAGMVIGWMKISQGGVADTPVDARLVCKAALDTLATQVILVHNHPSGSTRPSGNDRHLTQKIKAALQIFSINLVDHIIVTEDKYYSFAEEGLI